MREANPLVLTIVGSSGSGKTTLLEKLIPELKRRGFCVASVKHSHKVLDLDRRGKDSWRHRQAGANPVIVSGSGEMAMIRSGFYDSLDTLLPYLDEVDIVLAEGFKRDDQMKIEVFRKSPGSEALCLDDPNLIALVTDAGILTSVPVFGLEEIEPLADFIQEKIRCEKQWTPGCASGSSGAGSTS